MLMRRAYAGQAARDDLAALGYELAEQAIVLVVDVFDFFGAELANFLAPEKFASTTAFAGRAAGTASAAAEARAIAAGTVAARAWS